MIRGWLLALDRQDYEQAAYYFAPNALIDQGNGPYRLRTQDEAFAFNAVAPLPRRPDPAEGRRRARARDLPPARRAGRRLQRPA